MHARIGKSFLSMLQTTSEEGSIVVNYLSYVVTIGHLCCKITKSDNDDYLEVPSMTSWLLLRMD